MGAPLRRLRFCRQVRALLGEQLIVLVAIECRRHVVGINDLGRIYGDHENRIGCRFEQLAIVLFACLRPLLDLALLGDVAGVDDDEGVLVAFMVVERRRDQALLPAGEERLISATLDHHERDEDSFVIVYARDITEQREVEERAQASEEQYRQLFESASDAVFVVAIDTSQIIDANNMASALYGYEHDELLTKKSTDLSAEPEATQRRTHEAQTKPGQVLTIPLRLHRKRDGTVFPVEITARNTVWGKQQVILVACRDITERRQAEEEIRRMALAVDTAPNSITVYDFDGRFLYANQRTFELHGYSRDEFLALDLRQLDVPAAEGLVAARMQELRERGEASFEAAHFRKDGTSLPVDVRAKVTTWGGKEAILSVATDLTERKQAEENLACLNQQNELILRSAAEGILGLDLQGNHTFVNPAAASMLGYAAGELLGRPGHSAWHHTKPDGSPYAREECAIYAAYRDGAVHRASTEVFWRKDGTSFPVEYASTPIYEQGRLAGAVVTFADITDRRQAEEELRLSQQRLSLHVEQTPLAVIEFDLEGRVREWNPAAAAVFGYSREAAIGQYWTFIVPAAIHGQLEGVWAAIVGQRGGNRSTNENITKDGQKIRCEWFSTPLAGRVGVAGLDHVAHG